MPDNVAPPRYVDPDTGAETNLDPVQKLLYHELVDEHGLHPRDAAIAAYLLDAEDIEQRKVDWSRIFLGSGQASKIAGLARAYLSTASRMEDRPDLSPAIKVKMGSSQTFRLWTIGRMKWLAGRG